jgi:hypothetical protein
MPSTDSPVPTIWRRPLDTVSTGPTSSAGSTTARRTTNAAGTAAPNASTTVPVTTDVSAQAPTPVRNGATARLLRLFPSTMPAPARVP